ncbi:LysR family transcriptional regulator [Nonomuraea sp. PA05]|uniref:LysR family transcriptional regulator n=1 Tax=Nonomuraea sp. PA05 TaxID=2604466 RepID=UPI0011DAB5B2|nr:LysR family transcriptional regulator [Nonomuraea sp. PA05]TYB54717.1 LysR family transcriptional regulator [Nonomuraea sp. PA05]
MERHEIETFLALSEELHFRRTAERLGLAQGRVSQIVKKLERGIGAPLFERTSRRVVLTPVGQRLRDGLLPGYQQIQRAIAEARAAARGVAGTLRVGFSAPWCAETLIAAADLFLGRNPGHEVNITEIQLHDPLGPMRAGQLDLQLTELPIDEPDITVGPVVFREPRVLIVPAAHPFTGRASVSLEDYAAEPVISIGGAVPDYWLEYHYPSRTPAGRPIPPGPVATYWSEILPLISSGRGVSPSNLRAARYHAYPGTAFVPVHDAPAIEYGLLWPAARESATVREFSELVRQVAGRPPGGVDGEPGSPVVP